MEFNCQWSKKCLIDMIFSQISNKHKNMEFLKSIIYLEFTPYLGEESGPVGLDGDTGGLDDGVDLLGGDGDVIVGKDEGGVNAGEFGSRHNWCKFQVDLAQNENKHASETEKNYSNRYITNFFLQ